MTTKDIVQGFVDYRKKIGKWYDDEKGKKLTGGVTWEHYEQGYEDGYKKRLQEEQEELMDAL
jgi:hypothetical protein